MRGKNPLLRRHEWRGPLFFSVWITISSLLSHSSETAAADTLVSGTAPLLYSSDRAADALIETERFLDRQLENAAINRDQFWKPDFSSAEAYANSVKGNRTRFQQMIGTGSLEFSSAAMHYVASLNQPSIIAETQEFVAHRVRWTVNDEIDAEGLLLLPGGKPTGVVVCIPDTDQTPEQLAGIETGLKAESQLARVFASNGGIVIVPTLVGRSEGWSEYGEPANLERLSHREWLDRQAGALGLRMIGMEVKTVRAAISALHDNDAWAELPVGVAGYGEGGLIAMFAAAVDQRIVVTLCSGYFGPRDEVWKGPSYRNLFGQLREFGDAEIARLIAPAKLIVEHSVSPQGSGLPREAMFHIVEREVGRANSFFPPGFQKDEFVSIASGNEGLPVQPGSRRAIRLFLGELGIPASDVNYVGGSVNGQDFDIYQADRERRLVKEWSRHLREQVAILEKIRNATFERAAENQDASSWPTGGRLARRAAMQSVLGGPLPDFATGMNPRSRLIEENERLRVYEVAISVWEGLDVWGYLVMPNGMAEGAPRPVVVCQHGTGHVPADTVFETRNGRRIYHKFATRLAERGFITFAPFLPMGGEEGARLEQKANALGLTMSSIFIREHQRILEWLSTLSAVDASRIGIYGFGSGGRMALEAAALLDGYQACVASGAFTETIRQRMAPGGIANGWSLNFGQAREFGHAELAAMIAPRPFMVEKGHFDPTSADEWVAYEYAKVRKFYGYLGIPDRTQIEFFVGPPTINGEGTFEFLEEWLDLPPQNQP